MEAVITCTKNTIRLYLTAEGCSTDIPARAAVFRDLTDAALAAGRARAEREWFGFAWEPAYRLGDGSLAMPSDNNAPASARNCPRCGGTGSEGGRP